MPARLREMIPIRQFSSGRRTLVYNRVRRIARRRGLVQLVGHIDRALAHERRTRELENRWSTKNNRQLHHDQLPALDNRVDQVLTSIRDIAAGQARGLHPDHPLVATVERFVDAVFPHGVLAVTTLPYVDQVLATEAIVRTLQGGMAATAHELGLDARVQHLAEMTAEYRLLVDAGRGEVTYEAVHSARERGQLYLREVIALVVGTFFDSDDPDHVAARDELLAPVSDQLAELFAQVRARRRNGRRPGDAPDEVSDAAARDGEPDEGAGDLVDDARDGDAAVQDLGDEPSA